MIHITYPYRRVADTLVQKSDKHGTAQFARLEKNETVYPLMMHGVPGHSYTLGIWRAGYLATSVVIDDQVQNKFELQLWPNEKDSLAKSPSSEDYVEHASTYGKTQPHKGNPNPEKFYWGHAELIVVGTVKDIRRQQDFPREGFAQDQEFISIEVKTTERTTEKPTSSTISANTTLLIRSNSLTTLKPDTSARFFLAKPLHENEPPVLETFHTIP